MFEGMEHELPLPTRIVLAISIFFRRFWFIALPVSVWGFVMFVRFTSTPLGKKWLNFLEKDHFGWVELICLVCAFIVVGFIVISMFLPMFGIISLA